MGLNHSSRIVTDGLVLCLDAANIKSYKNYNLATYSQDFTNAVWVKSTGLVSATGLLAPDNTFTASTLTDDLNNNYENWSRSYTIPNDSASYNISIFIKKTTGGTSTRTGFNVSLTGGTTKNYNVRFNADTGVAVNGDTNLVTSENNSFWRLSFTVSNNGTGNTTLGISYYPATGFYNSGDDSTATGSHTVWGMQITRGATLLPYLNNVNDSVDVWTDLSDKSNNGTLTNNPAYSAKYISFDGVNDYVTVPSSGSLNFSTAVFTVETWIKVISFPSTTAHNIVSKKPRFNNTVKGWQCQLDNRTTGFMQLRTNDGTTLNDNVPTSIVDNSTLFTTPTNWLQLVWAVTTGSVSFYINGTFNNTQTFTMSSIDNTDAFEIGKPALGFDVSPSMYVAQVKVYNKQLSATEIQQNFNAIRGRFGI